MIKLAVKIDNPQFERNQEKKGETKFNIPPKRTKMKQKRMRMWEGDPMDLDKVQLKGPLSGVSKKEKEKRKKDRLYLKCGEKGHFMRECGAKKAAAVKLYQCDPKDHWTRCYDDYCQIYYSSKNNSEHFPEAPSKSRKVAIILPKFHENAKNLTLQRILDRIQKEQCWMCEGNHTSFICTYNHWDVPFTEAEFWNAEKAL